MKKIIAFAGMLSWGASAALADGGGNFDQIDVDGPVAPITSSPVTISVVEHARLMHRAGLRVRSLGSREQDSRVLIEAIRAEPDRAAREAQWSAWLDGLAAAGELEPPEVEALIELEESTPVVAIPHHEFPSRSMPAFALAGRASALLARQARSSRARELAASPADLSRALEAAPDTSAHAAGLDALEFVAPALLDSIVDGLRTGRHSDPVVARVLLRAAEIAPAHAVLLAEVVRRGDVPTARRALVLAMDRGDANMPEIAETALARSELGGLALAAARQAGMHPDRFCWALLGDPSFGADAARMLAAESDRLIEEISVRVADASGLARLRMLLALRIRDSEASRAMLAELAEAPWLSEQQRREVRSWH